MPVGEFGTLLKAEIGSARFSRPDPGNLPPANLLFAAGHASTGWVLAHQARTELHFSNLATGQWLDRAAPQGHRIIGPDQGKTWCTEDSNFDLPAYVAQRKRG